MFGPGSGSGNLLLFIGQYELLFEVARIEIGRLLFGEDEILLPGFRQCEIRGCEYEEVKAGNNEIGACLPFEAGFRLRADCTVLSLRRVG